MYDQTVLNSNILNTQHLDQQEEEKSLSESSGDTSDNGWTEQNRDPLSPDTRSIPEGFPIRESTAILRPRRRHRLSEQEWQDSLLENLSTQGEEADDAWGVRRFMDAEL